MLTSVIVTIYKMMLILISIVQRGKGENKWQSILNINTIRTNESEKVYVNNVEIHQTLFVQSVKIENNIRSKVWQSI